MINRRSIVSLVMLCTAVGISTASAQTPPAAASRGVRVALLDVAYIFKNHKGFEAKMQGLRTQKEAIEKQVLESRNALLNQRKGLQSYNPGTPQYKQIEEQLANSAADAQVKMELQKKNLLEQEAKVYLETYNEIQNAVKTFSAQHQIGLVLRYDSQQIDPNNPQDILKGINRAVIHQQNLDITRMILGMLNPQQPGSAPRTQGTARQPANNIRQQ